jgi:hypothetical protein
MIDPWLYHIGTFVEAFEPACRTQDRPDRVYSHGPPHFDFIILALRVGWRNALTDRSE